MRTLEGSNNWFMSQFPESLWPPSKEDYGIYKEHCIIGKHRMAYQKVLICGLARNCEKNLINNIARIERLGMMFDDYDVFVFENDSEDDTKGVLQRWKYRNPRVSIQSETLGKKIHEQDHSEERTVDMAYYRNMYLEYAKRHAWDYLIVFDFDLQGGFSYEGICNSFGYNDWDAIGSNGLYYENHEGQRRRLFYDSWAFRQFGDEIYRNVNLNRYERGEEPIEVFSCFGGLSIYKRDSIKEEYKYKSGDCDHPTLHKQMRADGFKIFINPSQITLYNEHNYK